MTEEEREDVRRLDAEEGEAVEWLAAAQREDREQRFAEEQRIAARAAAAERAEIDRLIAPVEARHAAENVTAPRLGLEAAPAPAAVPIEQLAVALLDLLRERPALARAFVRVFHAAQGGETDAHPQP